MLIASNYVLGILYGIVIYKLIQVLYNINPGRTKVIWYIILGSLLLGTINALEIDNIYKTLILIIYWFIANITLFSLKVRHSFLITGVLLILVALGDVVCHILLVNILGYEIYHIQSDAGLTIIANGVCILIITSFVFLIKNIKNIGKNNNFARVKVDYKVILLVIVALLLIYLNIYLIFNTGEYDFIIILIFSLSLASFLILVLVLLYLRSNFILEKRENEQLKIYIQTISELSEELRRFKHNYLNILHGLSGFIEVREWDKLEAYVGELVDDGRKIANSNFAAYNNIKDPGLCGLLSSKISKASSAGIEVKLSIDGVIGETMIKNHELYEVLGIYLDNAIEAVQNTENKWIDINMLQENNYLHITINNYIDDPVALSDVFQEGYSTKGENRGDGLRIAEKILSGYRNVLHNTFIEDKSFMQELVIPTEKQG